MKSKLSYFLLLLFFSVFISSTQAVENLPSKTVIENQSKKIYNLPYGPHKRNIMDVFLPADRPEDTPLVMIIHGGAWKMGRKEHLMMIQDYLYRHNVPTASINYRLLSKGLTYKDQLADIDQAVKKTQSMLSEWHINPDKVILLGESAGGHLALLYGYSHPNRVSKLISLSGPTDFYSENYRNHFYYKYTHGVFEDVVGEKFDKRNLSDKFKEASPVAHVSQVPTLLFQGDRDILVNKQQGLDLDSALTKNNVPHELVYMKNAGHVSRFFNKKLRDSVILPNILKWVKKDFSDTTAYTPSTFTSY